jgi:anti-anti-sigma factor
MSVRFETQDQQLKCIFETDVIASAIAEMRERFNIRFDEPQGWNEVILDMENVDKVDSLGINLIVWLFRLAKGMDLDFKLVGCNKRLIKLFTLFRLQDQFTIETLETEKKDE